MQQNPYNPNDSDANNVGLQLQSVHCPELVTVRATAPENS